MSSRAPRPGQISIPDVDIWTFLFERHDKPYHDDQPIFFCASTQRCYTYQDVRSTAIKFGKGLRNTLSWQKGDIMSIFSANSIDIPSVVWGCHWAGGIVSPSNPTFTAEELTRNLKASDARALITQKSLLKIAIQAAKAAGLQSNNIFLIGDEKENEHHVKHFTALLNDDDSIQRAKTASEDLAFLVYSSGTTGLPKGVMLSHRNIVANQSMCRTVEGRMLDWNRDKILSILPFYHIYVHQPLLLGVSTVVMSKFDIDSFCSVIQRHRITYTYVAPPIVLYLAKSPTVDLYDLSSLRMMTCGAAPVSKELILAVYKRLGVPVKQAYGLSETSPMTHCQTLETWKSAIGSVGQPLPNLQLKFVGPDNRQVQCGEQGELWIKGPSIFKGYYKDPTATREALTSDGYFKTGDIGFEDEESNFYITDRVKDLIKYKGSQIAPAELEGLLISHPMVNDTAVIGQHNEVIATEVPVAFIVPEKNVPRTEVTAAKIIQWLQARTGKTKHLRGGIIWVDQIPKSASGKILRRDLKRLIEGPSALVAIGGVNYTARSML